MKRADQIKRAAIPPGRLALGLTVVATMLLVMKNGSMAADAVRKGLWLCADTMIPSLFPFMVLSELIVRTGVGRGMARCVSWLLRPVFGLSESGACALVMGWLCGFPVGAKTAAGYYRHGEMDAREFNHVLAFCNVPSSAFLLSAVGRSLFDSAAMGRALLALTLMGAVLIGLLWRAVLPRRICVSGARADACACERRVGVSVLPASIGAAADSMLGVCATVVLFCALVGALSECLGPLDGNGTVRAALFGLFELSTGISEAVSACNGQTAAILCAAMAGFGGLSVHCQILAVCDGCPVALGPFWTARILAAVLGGAGMWGMLKWGGLSLATDALVAFPLTPPSQVKVVWGALCGGVLLMATVWRLSCKYRKEAEI